jgi:hypothetical protein
MSTHAYAGDEFWRGAEWLGLDSLVHGFAARKLQMVYIHWVVLLIFIIATLWAAFTLIRRRRQLLHIVPFGIVPLLLAYCLLVGLSWFNTLAFRHAMMEWSFGDRFLSMLWSMVVAGVPVLALYLGQPSTSVQSMTSKDRVVLHLAIFPIVHSLLTTVCLLKQDFIVE